METSAKARDLEANPHYALHAHMDPSAPHEFMVRGELGERDNADDWPPRYRSWRSA